MQLSRKRRGESTFGAMSRSSSSGFKRTKPNRTIASNGRGRSSFLLLTNPGDIVTDRVIVPLVYNETVQLVNALATYAEYEFRGNSLFDPNFTGVGHQPLGFDQLSTLYSQYRVISSKIVVDWCNQFSGQAARCCVYPTDQSGSAGGYDAAAEQPYSKASYSAGINGGPNLTRTTNWMSTKKINGQKDIMTQSQYAALTSANPADVWFWHLSIANIDASVSVNCYANVKIVYTAEFSDRIRLTSS